MTALDNQVDGTHYKTMLIQPILLAYIVANGDACFCKAAKYISRDKEDAAEDLLKAAHVAELLSLRKGYGHNAVDFTPAHVELIRAFVKQYNGPESHVTFLYHMATGDVEKAIQSINYIIKSPSRVWYDHAPKGAK